jgi:hypothetical protein
VVGADCMPSLVPTMTDLRTRFRSIDDMAVPELWSEVVSRVDQPLEFARDREYSVRVGRSMQVARSGRRGRVAAILVTALALAVLVGASLFTAGRTRPAPEPRPSPTDPVPAVWPGPIRPALAPWPERPVPTDTAEDGGLRWVDDRDVAWSIIDITRVGTDNPQQRHWRIALDERPPRAIGLDPDRTLISYGLVFETTGDERGDYIVGINNDAPNGGFRVWVTDVATGMTEEQIGPPYGFPIEFSHPDERAPEDPPLGVPGEPTLVFTFLGDSAPPGLRTSRFYAWSSLALDGEVVAWDYAPDASWLRVGGSGESVP